MLSSKVAAFLCTAALLLAGCAARKYRPAPLAPAKTASQLETRSLGDPGLRQFLGKSLERPLAWPPESWDLNTLTLAAFYFNPELEVARARVGTAEAAIQSAGARPNPNLSVKPGVPSPYLFGLDFVVPIETAGKRGYRIERAERLNDAARLDLTSAAWRVRSRVRQALLDHLLAARTLDLLRGEERIRSQRVDLLEQRLAVGEIPRPEVDTARIERLNTRLAIRTAEGRVSETRAALAAAIGVPIGALESVRLSWPALDQPPSAESLSPGKIQREAVLNRLDVRRALAEYAAAEADLQLEIAKQYPNFNLGPGYQFEERNNFFTVGFSTILPIFNRNQGPIAEAAARRREAAARFLATQARVIADSEKALSRYRAALAELSEVEQSLLKLQDVRQRMTRRAVELGEADRLALSGIELESSVAARAKLDALSRAQAALGALEDAVQRPLQGGELMLLTPQTLTPHQKSKGAKP